MAARKKVASKKVASKKTAGRRTARKTTPRKTAARKTAARKTAKRKTAKKKVASNKAARGAVPVKQEDNGLRSLADFNFHDIEKLFQDFISRRPFSAVNWPAMPDFDELRAKMQMRLPDVDILDRKKEVMIKAELPGCNKDDVDISIAGNSINITAKHRDKKQSSGENYVRKEISSRQYNRTLPLPAGVDTGKAQAKMKKGVLQIRLPKLGGKKTKRVSVG